MLRISFDSNSKSRTLRLVGAVSGPWVDELERTWYVFTREKPPDTVTIDLSGVNFIDAEGEKLLRWMVRQGAELCDCLDAARCSVNPIN